MTCPFDGMEPNATVSSEQLKMSSANARTELRASGKWTYSDSRQKVIPKFNRAFGRILGRADIEHGTFHDLRRTAISNWPAKGLSEFEVMKLATCPSVSPA